jgi:hypothetical protein
MSLITRVCKARGIGSSTDFRLWFPTGGGTDIRGTVSVWRSKGDGFAFLGGGITGIVVTDCVGRTSTRLYAFTIDARGDGTWIGGFT